MDITKCPLTLSNGLAMHEERDTLWHFVMSIVKYRESHYVTVLDMYVRSDALYLRTDQSG